MKHHYDCRESLQAAGFRWEDACALRRISMTLHRWHELECGDSNDYASWCVTRGYMRREGAGKWFEHDDNGNAFIERHYHSENKARYESIPDRERGALKRLAAIVARYPGFGFYVQGDPRGGVPLHHAAWRCADGCRRKRLLYSWHCGAQMSFDSNAMHELQHIARDRYQRAGGGGAQKVHASSKAYDTAQGYDEMSIWARAVYRNNMMWLSQSKSAVAGFKWDCLALKLDRDADGSTPF
jgi:hypothetical protein